MPSFPNKNSKIVQCLFQGSHTEAESASPKVEKPARNGPPRSLTNIPEPPKDTREKVSLFFFTLKMSLQNPNILNKNFCLPTSFISNHLRIAKYIRKFPRTRKP